MNFVTETKNKVVFITDISLSENIQFCAYYFQFFSLIFSCMSGGCIEREIQITSKENDTIQKSIKHTPTI